MKPIRQKFVYHYTSIETLFAILEGYRKSKESNVLTLRASNIYRVNDPKEMVMGYDVLKKWIRRYEDSQCIPVSIRLSEVYQNEEYEAKCKSDYLQTRNADFIEVGEVPYVISFSFRHDYLPMWGLYGDKGKGVCLKFALSELQSLTSSLPGLVNYCGRTNLEGFKNTMEFMYGCYMRELKDMEVPVETKIRELATICLTTAPFVKHKDYQYEKEYRFVFYNWYNQRKISMPSHKTSIYKILPYIEVAIPVKALQGIIIGPDVNFDVMKHVVRKELEECRLNAGMVTKSRISYRNN